MSRRKSHGFEDDKEKQKFLYNSSQKWFLILNYQRLDQIVIFAKKRQRPVRITAVRWVGHYKTEFMSKIQFAFERRVRYIFYTLRQQYFWQEWTTHWPKSRFMLMVQHAIQWSGFQRQIGISSMIKMLWRK